VEHTPCPSQGTMYSLRGKQGRIDRPDCCTRTANPRPFLGRTRARTPEELAETEPVGPDAWTFLSFNYHPASALAA